MTPCNPILDLALLLAVECWCVVSVHLEGRTRWCGWQWHVRVRLPSYRVCLECLHWRACAIYVRVRTMLPPATCPTAQRLVWSGQSVESTPPMQQDAPLTRAYVQRAIGAAAASPSATCKLMLIVLMTRCMLGLAVLRQPCPQPRGKQSQHGGFEGRLLRAQDALR